MSPTPEAQLAYLGFRLFTPGPSLRPYVRSYWHFRRATPLVAYHEEYMHPQGGFGIIFNFGDSLYVDGQVVTAPLFLDGTNSVSRRLGFLGRVELMGIRFEVGGAYPFFGIPLNELRNQLTLLDALDRPNLLSLHARLQEAAHLPARIALLEEWLLGRLARGKQGNALIPASLALLRRHTGQLPIAELADALALSQRQLERVFQHQVGMPPKQYARLLRVEAARLALKQPVGAQSTTALAADLGFYDQSHFIREFSAVIGMTPYAYLKRNRK